MGVVMKIAIILSVLFVCFAGIVIADGGYRGTGDCSTMCENGQYEAAFSCLEKTRDKKDAYLAVSHCALNNNDDSQAERYALKSARARAEWIMWARNIPFVADKIRTGGLGESYVAAYVASENERYKDKAISYLRTSGQCKGSSEVQACAEGYFNNVEATLSQRRLVTARGAGGKTGASLHGKVTDHDSNPLKHVRVALRCGGKTHKTNTDAQGNYRFTFKDEELMQNFCLTGRLYVQLSYKDPKDGKTYFRILYKNKPVVVMKKFKIEGTGDLRQNFHIKKGLDGPEYYGVPRSKSTYHFASMYHHMTQALLYFKDHLKVDLDYKLPVDVKAFAGNSGTYYSPVTSTIVIEKDNSRYQSSNRPDNREFHEFAHHAMYSMYRKWPDRASKGGVKVINHDGYINPTTSDSYAEGFAEYMALVISDHYRFENPDVYAGFGSLELNWRAWHRRGLKEEIALAGLLWDLYDPKNDDQVDLTEEEIWNVLKVYSDNFDDVYEMLVRNHPREKDAIDDVFKQHGFFRDTNPGNNRRDPKEPYRDANDNGQYDDGELFVDYPQVGNLQRFVYDAGEEIGPATNYHRQARESEGYIDGYFVRVAKNIPLFNVKVESVANPEINYEITVDNLDGKVYVSVPPIEYADAVVTVTAASGETGSPLVIKASEFDEEFPFAQDRGFNVEHDFEVTGGEVFIDDDPEDPRDVEDEPYWEVMDVPADPQGFGATIDDDPEEFPLEPGAVIEEGLSAVRGDDSGGLPWTWTIVGVIVVLLLLRLKGRKKRKEKKRQKKEKKKAKK